MHWIAWLLVFVSLGVPVGSLVVDRILGIPARKLFVWWGVPSLVVFILGTLYAAATRSPLLELIIWGVIAGWLATAALDTVRLIGVRFKAFPLDMPMMFGAIALGLAPKLQRNMMGQMVAHIAGLPEPARRQMLEERLKALVRLPEPMRATVMAAMRRGLDRLPEEKRLAVVGTQLDLMAEMASPARATLLTTMDQVLFNTVRPVYAQPRGLPKLPMALFREFMERAYPLTLQEENVSHRTAAFWGYLWHFTIGATFGITYTLLFGQGSWPLALGWGIFVWLSMMILMPPMMPLIRFPWWFPIVPFIAHIAMAIPIGYVALNYLDPAAHAASLFGALGWLP